ncbi:MAG: GTP 3',8-cyclase MoaA [Clostridia bacterium]|nr:GTP 3',8-cyclase MoaA [Clostridiales bacterium]
MRDIYNRRVDYMRISVTDRCNLRCFYCMPEEGVCKMNHRDVLRYEEIIRVVREGAGLGISRIRLTGGEPLVRPGIVSLVREIRGVEGIEEISLTTNGLLLKDMAANLKHAGLDRVNVSLDSLVPEKYKEITRGGDLKKVLEGICASIEVGLKPVKINVVIMKGINDDEIEDLVKLTRILPISVRFIELMPIGHASQRFKDHYISMDSVMDRIPDLVPDDKVQGGGPAVNYRLPGAMGTVGFIGALSHNFCHRCNRIRLTADGKIKPCLHSDLEVDLRPALREGKGSLGEMLARAIGLKPRRHCMDNEDREEGNRDMYQIGG